MSELFPASLVLLVSAMAEIHGDAASMDRNMMMRPLSTDDNRKTEVLHELQGSFYFEKTLPATSVGMKYVLVRK